MALVALQIRVPAGKWEPHSVVVETCGLPRGSRVALLAGLWQSQRYVIRVARLLEVWQVTANAGCRRSFVLSPDVTGSAINGRVHARQGEPGEFQVIELRSQPGIDGVALFALRGESAGHVVRRVRLLKCVLVARVALNRQALELPYGFTLVTVRAVEAGVAPNQWEAVIVLPHILLNQVPPFHRVALLTICSHLATVNVGMAIRAMCTRIREHGLGMALVATHSLVKAAQRVRRLVVIKLRNRPDGLPAD